MKTGSLITRSARARAAPKATNSTVSTKRDCQVVLETMLRTVERTLLVTWSVGSAATCCWDTSATSIVAVIENPPVSTDDKQKLKCVPFVRPEQALQPGRTVVCDQSNLAVSSASHVRSRLERSF